MEEKKIRRIVNEYFKSNSYIITISDNFQIIIDPGSSLPPDVIRGNSSGIEQIVFLTHEHTDHIIGLRNLPDYVKIICSENCAKNIADSKQNYSYFSENIKPFVINNQTITYRDKATFIFENQSFHFLETPGHSPGSACIFFENFVFTGDTILNGIKTPLIFPHSDRAAYKDSLMLLSNLIKPESIILPGHGEPFDM